MLQSMKTINTLNLLALAGLISLTSCTTVVEKDPTVHAVSTTTEQTTVTRPYVNSVETQTTRSYR